jgi:hypothetical protein
MSDDRVERCVAFLRENASRSSFYASVLSQFEKFGSLTVRQLEAVERGMTIVPSTNDDPVTEIGMYERDGVLYRVKKSGTGNLYAMRFVPTGATKSERYEYAKGVIRALSAHDRMTVERCAELGVAYSVCVICGADLSDPKSVARGMGPTCAKKV